MNTRQKRKRAAPRKSSATNKSSVTKRKIKKPDIPPQYATLAEFRYQLRVFLEHAAKNAENANLTAQQYQALLAIKGTSGDRPMFVGALAQSLLIKHHTAVELVDRMVKLALLRRSSDPDDQRRVLVTLTRKGVQRLEKVAKLNVQHLRSTGHTMSRMFRLFRHARK